jgi:hypothetical protein
MYLNRKQRKKAAAQQRSKESCEFWEKNKVWLC